MQPRHPVPLRRPGQGRGVGQRPGHPSAGLDVPQRPAPAASRPGYPGLLQLHRSAGVAGRFPGRQVAPGRPDRPQPSNRSGASILTRQISSRKCRFPLPSGFFLLRNQLSPDPKRMPKDVILTPEGLANLKSELDELTTKRRREVAQRIKEAREFGDISENAEYDDAKNEQAMLEARIATLEDKLRSATVIDASQVTNDVVGVGSIVHVKDEAGKSTKYTIVGSAEASPGEMKLSNESPVGKALLGRKRGEEVVITTPRGSRKLKITKIDVAK